MQLAAQQNYATAQRSLGELVENGSGITPDITIASHWYGLAAGQGDPIAKKHLQRSAQSNTLL
jgi:TPR repeat protein